MLTLIQENRILVLIIIFLLLCAGAKAVNVIYFNYPGNHYVPLESINVIIVFLLISLGLRIQFGDDTYGSDFLRECALGLFVFTIIFWGTEAIQQTPFMPIDNILISLDALLHIRVNNYVKFLENWQSIKAVLEYVYDLLVIEMVVVPILLLALQRYALIYEYYRLIFITAIIGYSIYYFFPTVAPATAIGGMGFSQSQLATGVKFYEIHHHILPSTADGGMISFPSFHAIWALLLTYAVRCWRIMFYLLMSLNIVIIISCVALGWHYLVDIIGSVLIVLLSIWFNNFFLGIYSKAEIVSAQSIR